ncbi:uncharacterized protein F5Z01DRAFT_546749 [Emericellopsis atlantica]|uniref:N-acetyltransferase domain-containing protein n=1 Tax=Emericellopsis atlantica TaxID=2614577 RepID=A0A9P7ZNU6_9HYPO|nr:uncharacterized protein F5Z01DRAFT_546749 [Emericellopsis atlantica]KAG9255544.1 hypothetical protein F5Z01DRAFT_546749 [Emericellopsis atlantica]
MSPIICTISSPQPRTSSPRGHGTREINMASSISTTSHVPEGLIALLESYLPNSLPLLRRLQFAQHEGRITPTARIIFIHNGPPKQPQYLAAAYVDLAGGPETQMWLFSTLEVQPAAVDVHAAQLQALVGEMIEMKRSYGKKLWHEEGVLLGTCETGVRRVLTGMKRLRTRETGFYDKWLFQQQNLPTQRDILGAKGAERREDGLEEGMRWDVASLEDCEIVVTRTDIPRTAPMLATLPSLVIRLDDGRPIAWAFLGHDGSLISLHCEDFRRRGLAKLLAARLMRQGPGDFVRDGWCSADVSASNEGSRAMCRSLGGRPDWEVSWVYIDVTEDGVTENGY